MAAAVFGCRSAASDLTSGPAAAPPQHDGETAGPVENTLNWSTASEVDNFGFDIYRATTEEGPFTRITQEPIQGAGTTDEPQHYSFVDDTIESGTGYYYYIESISMTGARERFSPVVFAKPKEQPLPIGENADP